MVEKHKHTNGVGWGQAAIFASAVLLFIAVLIFLPDTVSWPARSTIAIMVFGLVLWAFAPIPIELTSIVIIVLLIVMKPVEMDVILSGFASPAVFLIIGGMMMAVGVNQTLLVKRMTYFLLSLMGKSAKGIYVGFFILMQVQAFLIPATAVRASLMLPILSSIIEETGVDERSNFNKLM